MFNYNHARNKPLGVGWKHLIDGAKRTAIGCLEPIGHVDRHGYKCLKFNGKQWVASRFSYTVHFGEVPNGLLVCHSCDNPKCIEITHLWLGTPLENSKDRDRKGRHKTADPSRTTHFGEDHGFSVLSNSDVLGIRKEFLPGPKKNGHGNNTNILAEKYKVTPKTINAIIKRKAWKHI